MIAEVIQEFMSNDWLPSFTKVLFHTVAADKDKFYKETVVPQIEKYAPLVEKFLLENGNNGLFLGDRETWVDVFAAETFSKLIDYGSPDALDAYPHILALINRIFNHPNIKKYVAARKSTPF
uniref:GST C-terminal domain-containing protein n=1 Tax=Caenorhabditis japonica TaxID=281687 RepID=A0A8R1DRS4_CAEJA